MSQPSRCVGVNVLSTNTERLMPLMSANFVESNPIPVKAAMAAMGLLEEVYRLPMVPPLDGSRQRILSALVAAHVFEAAGTATR